MAIRELVGREIDTACAIDLLLYFYRHPNVYVTTDWLPARVGYGAEDVEVGIEALVKAGVIVRRHHPTLPAVMYRVAVARSSPASAQNGSMSRWRRQRRLLLKSWDRYRRAAMHYQQARDRIERTAALLAALRTQGGFRRGG